MRRGVFISYRRSDTAAVAGRLFDVLETRFGDQTFMDVVAIRPGVNFVEEIRAALASCSMVLVLVGERWLSLSDARKRSGEDFVRLEIAAAHQMGVSLMPVLVDGAQLPAEHDLPEELRPLAHIEPMQLRQATFERDAAELCATLLARAGVPPLNKVDAFLERFKIAGIQKLDERMLRMLALGSMGMNGVTLIGLGAARDEPLLPLFIATLAIAYGYMGRRSVKYGIWGIRAMWIAAGLVLVQAVIFGYLWFVPPK